MFKWIEGMKCSLLKSRALLYSEDLHFLPNLLFFGDVSVILSPLVTGIVNMLICLDIQLEEGSNVENLQAQRCRALASIIWIQHMLKILPNGKIQN